MSTRQTRKPKSNFKPPEHVPKNTILAVFTTSKNICLEGYTGTITYIDSIKDQVGLIPCRAVGKHGGKAWVKIS